MKELTTNKNEQQKKEIEMEIGEVRIIIVILSDPATAGLYRRIVKV